MTFNRGDRVNVSYGSWCLRDFSDPRNTVATFSHEAGATPGGRGRAFVSTDDGLQRRVWLDSITRVEENHLTPNDDKDNSMDNIKVGDLVTIEAAHASRYYTGAGNPNKYVPVEAGDKLTVTRVYTDTVIVRTEVNGSTHLHKRVLLPYRTPEQIEAERTARLEAAKGADAIAVDDPRIAWIWAEAARLADEAGHCSEYDDLAEALGVPGRDREFSVSIELPEGEDHESWDMTLTVKAQDKVQALATARLLLERSILTVNED